MNLAQIKYFLALCEVGTFTGAAAICGISQQSLSAAIWRLEHELGRPLFDRGPPLRLSQLGEAVKPHFEARDRQDTSPEFRRYLREARCVGGCRSGSAEQSPL